MQGQASAHARLDYRVGVNTPAHETDKLNMNDIARVAAGMIA